MKSWIKKKNDFLGTLQLLKILFNELIILEIELLVMENAADCMYGSVMMKEDKDQYIANFLNTMDQDFLSKFHHKMNSSTSSSSSTDSNEMFEEPKLKNMKLKAVQSEETNMVKINLLRTWNACQQLEQKQCIKHLDRRYKLVWREEKWNSIFFFSGLQQPQLQRVFATNGV